jgi:transcriptional regulator with XRE-family HTH domain
VKVERQFAANLRSCRKRAGLSQVALGFRASLHRTEIGLLEHGARVPRIDTLIKLAAALTIPPGDLLEGIGWESGAVGEPIPGRFIETIESGCSRRTLSWLLTD